MIAAARTPDREAASSPFANGYKGGFGNGPVVLSRRIPAHVALYCKQTGQDVPHPYEAS